MDGENNGKPYEQMDDLGVQYHYFRKHPFLFTHLPGIIHFLTKHHFRSPKLREAEGSCGKREGDNG